MFWPARCWNSVSCGSGPFSASPGPTATASASSTLFPPGSAGSIGHRTLVLCVVVGRPLLLSAATFLSTAFCPGFSPASITRGCMTSTSEMWQQLWYQLSAISNALLDTSLRAPLLSSHQGTGRSVQPTMCRSATCKRVSTANERKLAWKMLVDWLGKAVFLILRAVSKAHSPR